MTPPPIQPTAEQREAAWNIVNGHYSEAHGPDCGIPCGCDNLIIIETFANTLAHREALAAYSASQEVLRSVEQVEVNLLAHKDEKAGLSSQDVEWRQTAYGAYKAVAAAKTACEKFPKP